MYADKVLVNRRNINTDVSRKIDGCKKFFLLEVDARIIAGSCEILKVSSLDEPSSNHVLLQQVSSASRKEREDILASLSAKVVDTFIIRESESNDIIAQQAYQDWLLATNKRNADNLYICRNSGSGQTFKFDGKRRHLHEKSHGLHDEISSSSPKVEDYMFNYQCSMLDLGLIIKNFYDAVSEGDGMRVVRCWKYMLPYLKQDGDSSRKYALEALYLLCQVYAILSPRDAHRLIWNRFSKNKSGHGGNIPLDLALEHYNNLLKNVVKKLGPNSTNPKVIDRYCKALAVNKELIQNFDACCKVIRRSGKHVEANVTNDLKKILHELLSQKALHVTPGRKYESFRGMQPSLLTGFDIHAIYKWFQEHKEAIKDHKAGR